ncbi:MAG: isoprenyl transferase [Kiritimatiellaeota bacterium]|nr:isoprenyl transferase [Kiritimatiellota bacterium]
MEDHPERRVPRSAIVPADDHRPRHVAVIMDGNGRWARERGLPRIEGHRRGAQSVRRVVKACADAHIRYLTLYAFSTENWRRPPGEVRALMELLERFLKERLGDLKKHRIRLNAIGDLERLPASVRQTLDRVCRATSSYTEGVLTLALSYGGRAEIATAVRRIAREVRAGRLDPDRIDENTVTAHLDTAGLPDPDLIIRTSGEMRLSNFLLWQASYAELWVTSTYWPDFTEQEFFRAIDDYSRRRRRFGGVADA